MDTWDTHGVGDVFFFDFRKHCGRLVYHWVPRAQREEGGDFNLLDPCTKYVSMESTDARHVHYNGPFRPNIPAFTAQNTTPKWSYRGEYTNIPQCSIFRAIGFIFA